VLGLAVVQIHVLFVGRLKQPALKLERWTGPSLKNTEPPFELNMTLFGNGTLFGRPCRSIACVGVGVGVCGVVEVAAPVGEPGEVGFDVEGEDPHAVVRLISSMIPAMIALLEMVELTFFCIVVLLRFSGP